MSIKKKFLYIFYKKTIKQIKDYAEGNILDDEFIPMVQKKKSCSRLYLKTQSGKQTAWSLINEPFNRTNRIELIGLQIRLCSILDYFDIAYNKKLPDLLFWEKCIAISPRF